MSLFKRISATLVSRIDQVVGEIENHDAVIQTTLNDVRRKVAEARVRLARVQREGERLAGDIEQLRQQGERWRTRARETASSDEQKALECLRRARQCDGESERLEEAQTHYTQTADRLARDIQASEQRLRTLQQKLTLMRARESSGAALSATSEADGDAIRQLEDSFERWEINIGQLEMAVGHAPATDALERDFLGSEEEAALREELVGLLNREDTP